MLVHLPLAKVHLCPFQSPILRLVCPLFQRHVHHMAHSLPLPQYHCLTKCKFSNPSECPWYTTATRIAAVGGRGIATLLMSMTLNDSIEVWTGTLPATCVVMKTDGSTVVQNAI
jgi:hypothetical protein